MAERVDVVILGLGTGGEDLALRLLDGGLSVAGVEPQLLGGECPYWACIPSKMMIRAANLVAEARRADGNGARVDVTPDWSAVADRIRTEATGGWDDSVAVARFEERGGRFHRGYGRFVGPDTVAVGDTELTATRGIVIATGSKPATPPIPGLADSDYWTTHDAIAADTLPESLTVLGGGAVGCELGQVFARFGTDVTIVEGRERLLAGEEPEVSRVIEDVFARDSIDVRTGQNVERVDSGDGTITVAFADGTTLTSERLLVAAGRRVDLEGLGLENTDVDTSAGHVTVDERLHAADGIWAMGDVTGIAMFTHVAMYQGNLVAADLLGETPPPAEYHAIPRATFTDPEIGSVGLTESAARDAGVDVEVVVKQVPGTFRGWLQGPGNDGIIKLVVDRSSGTLVGATAAGPHGGEVLGLLAAAVHARVPLATLRHMIYAFPTFHGAIGEAIGAYGRGTGTVLDPATPPLLEP